HGRPQVERGHREPRGGRGRTGERGQHHRVHRPQTRLTPATSGRGRLAGAPPWEQLNPWEGCCPERSSSSSSTACARMPSSRPPHPATPPPWPSCDGGGPTFGTPSPPSPA